MPEIDKTSPRSPDEQLEWEIRNYGMTEEELRSKVVDGMWTDSVDPYLQAINILSDVQEVISHSDPENQMVNQAKWIIANLVAMPNFRTGDHYIPPLVKASIYRYVDNHNPVGSFLQAVLQNNLTRAKLEADYDSRRSILNIVHYVSGFVPTKARGSKESVDSWLQVAIPPHGPFQDESAL